MLLSISTKTRCFTRSTRPLAPGLKPRHNLPVQCSRHHTIEPVNLTAQLYRTFSSSSLYSDASSTPIATRNASVRAPMIAIVGSGPAGFYTSKHLQRHLPGTRIDMYEQLPAPFGLVRYGVAPDHPEVKNVIDDFEDVAKDKGFRFVGNVRLGDGGDKAEACENGMGNVGEVDLRLLGENYDGIVFAYGASKDRRLGIPGETMEDSEGQVLDTEGVYSARAFVGWYNGLPEYRELDPKLDNGDVAVVVGQGNVALDVARILLSDPERLEKTDLTSYAIEKLRTSTIRHVHVVGRRGPMQAAFTIKELRELLQLEGVNFVSVDKEMFPDDVGKLERPKKRLMQLLQKGRDNTSGAKKSWSLDFCLAPKEILREEGGGMNVIFTKTLLEDKADTKSKVTASDETVSMKVAILFRSIGYKAEAIPGMNALGAEFDEKRGMLKHDGLGRMITPDESKKGGAALYCAGWVKRGPTGVIAGTMVDAFQTAEVIVEDWKRALESGSAEGEKAGWPAVKAAAEAQGADLGRVVSWEGWHRIDQSEKEQGATVGKPREKIGKIKDMLSAATAA